MTPDNLDTYLLEMGIGTQERKLIVELFDRETRAAYCKGSNDCYKTLKPEE